MTDDEIKALQEVSIHAPVRVRPASGHANLHCWRFNPRTREGATQVHLARRIAVEVSIHAPVRVRHFDASDVNYPYLFQSTHP